MPRDRGGKADLAVDAAETAADLGALSLIGRFVRGVVRVLVD
ncbi:hypothetical protein ACFQ2B_16270 [Streptomyces stramineus]